MMTMTTTMSEGNPDMAQAVSEKVNIVLFEPEIPQNTGNLKTELLKSLSLSSKP